MVDQLIGVTAEEDISINCRVSHMQEKKRFDEESMKREQVRFSVSDKVLKQ